MFEDAAYDEDVNVLTPSFNEYAMPRRPTSSRCAQTGVSPGHTNPLGTKGVGEAGAIAAPPAVINVVLDALRPLGVVDIAMPCTPHRVWKAIQAATAGAS